MKPILQILTTALLLLVTIGGTQAQEPVITMTTTKAVGETISLAIDADAADQPNVWIDLNNNGTKEAGEMVTAFTNATWNGTQYTVAGQIIVIHGNVTLLGCNSNQLSALDVSNNTALTYLSCRANQLTELDISQNTALTLLECNYNSINSLDVSKNTALTSLYCDSNPLTALDVSKNIVLTKLSCSSNQLTELDLSQNTALTDLLCSSNQFSMLDVSRNTALVYLNCENDKLTVLDVSQNTALRHLNCNYNQLTVLDVSQNTALTNLHCYGNPFTTAAIDGIYCDLPMRTVTDNAVFYPAYSNSGTNADTVLATNSSIATGKGWKVQYWNGGEITTTGSYICGAVGGIGLSLTTATLGVGKTITITATVQPHSATNKTVTWSSSNNNIATVSNGVVTGVADGTATITATTEEGGKTATCSVFVMPATPPAGTPFITITVTNNATVELGMRAASDNTPTWVEASTGNYTLVVVGTGSTNTQPYTVVGNIIKVHGNITGFYCSGDYYDQQSITALDLSKNIALIELNCEVNQLTALDVSKNTALKYLNCNYNQLTVLDVSQNTALTMLDCQHNLLSALDVSQNTALKYLYCQSNQLKSLHVSQNTTLKYLYCHSNQLTSLDVSQNTALKYLFCHSNQLTSLDVSQDTALTYLYCYDNPFTTAAIDGIYCDLPERAAVDNAEMYLANNSSDANHADVLATNAANATDKGWKVLYNDNYSGSLHDTPILTTGSYVCVAVTGITLSEAAKTVDVNGTFTLVATVVPDDATNKAVTWSSSDESVAIVDANGVVKGIKEGSTTITATTANGNFTATCKVSVTPSTGVEADEANNLALYPNPTKGEVYIKGLTTPTPVKVYNTIGVEVLTKNLAPEQAISISNLQPGVYYIHVNGVTLKLLVK